MEYTKLSNDKLLEKYEEIMAEQLNLLREYFSRLCRREISNTEYERYKEISEHTAIALFDLLPAKADKMAVEGTVRDAVSNVVKKAYDKNR